MFLLWVFAHCQDFCSDHPDHLSSVSGRRTLLLLQSFFNVWWHRIPRYAEVKVPVRVERWWEHIAVTGWRRQVGDFYICNRQNCDQCSRTTTSSWRIDQSSEDEPSHAAFKNQARCKLFLHLNHKQSQWKETNKLKFMCICTGWHESLGVIRTLSTSSTLLKCYWTFEPLFLCTVTKRRMSAWLSVWER